MLHAATLYDSEKAYESSFHDPTNRDTKRIAVVHKGITAFFYSTEFLLNRLFRQKLIFLFDWLVDKPNRQRCRSPPSPFDFAIPKNRTEER